MNGRISRKPPLPESMKRMPPIDGVCRWCDKPVLTPKGEPTKGTWHKACVGAFKLLHWPPVTRRAVFDRDLGACAQCGADTVATFLAKNPHLNGDMAVARNFIRRNGGQYWQADHIKPLCEANGDISFWELPNLRTLCTPCHKAKTREDVARLARARRERKPASQTDLQPDLLTT